MISVTQRTRSSDDAPPPELQTSEYWRGIMRRARQDRDLTQADLARLVGVSQSMVSQIESGEINQSRAIYAVCDALGIPPPGTVFEDEDEQRWLEAGRLLRVRDVDVFRAQLEMLEKLVVTLSGRGRQG